MYLSINISIYNYIPINTRDTGDILLSTDSLCQQPVPDLPGEHGRVLLLVVSDGVDHGRCRHLWLAAADNACFVVASLIVPKIVIKNIRICIMRNRYSKNLKLHNLQIGNYSLFNELEDFFFLMVVFFKGKFLSFK